MHAAGRVLQELTEVRACFSLGCMYTMTEHAVTGYRVLDCMYSTMEEHAAIGYSSLQK